MSDVPTAPASNPQGVTTRKTAGGGKTSRIKHQVCQSVFLTLQNNGEVPAEDLPALKKKLRHHFDRLPTRYALEIHESDVMNVLLHIELLEAARDTDDPIINVRTVEASNGEEPNSKEPNSPVEHIDPRITRLHPPPTFGSSPNLNAMLLTRNGSQEGLTGLGSFNDLGENGSYTGSLTGSYMAEPDPYRQLSEITIAGRDKPQRLTTLAGTVCDVGLDVIEAHVFTTTDGFLLDIFVTDPLPGIAPDLMAEMLLESVRVRIQEGEGACKGSTPDKTAKQRRCTTETLEASRGMLMNQAEDEEVDVLHFLGQFEDWSMDASKLEVGNRIAGGSFADLHKGEYCGQVVAVKLLRLSALQGTSLREEFFQEVSILRKVRHKNVVQFIGVCTLGAASDQLCIVTEFMEGGSLYEHLARRQHMGLSPVVVTKIGLDVARGMSYLHQMGIVHRDLKASNLLIDEHRVVKVADFGVSRFQDDKGLMTAETGTYRWMAPEVIEHRQYDFTVDVYSFGVTLWELLTGKVPYNHLTPLQAAVGVVQKRLRPEIPESCPSDLAMLLQECWDQEPALRPDFSTVITRLQAVQRRLGSTVEAGQLLSTELSLATKEASAARDEAAKGKSFFASLRSLVPSKKHSNPNRPRTSSNQ